MRKFLLLLLPLFLLFIPVLYALTPPACTDSDNGKNYYTKGITSGIIREAIEYETISDVCILNGGLGDCTGNQDCKVAEYFCGDINFINVSLFSCTNGCRDGACIKEGQNLPKCYDSDNGNNPNVKGTAETYDKYGKKTKTVTDYCVSNNLDLPKPWLYVNEFVCQPDGSLTDNWIECKNGCKDGACIQDRIPINLNEKFWIKEGEKVWLNQGVSLEAKTIIGGCDSNTQVCVTIPQTAKLILEQGDLAYGMTLSPIKSEDKVFGFTVKLLELEYKKALLIVIKKDVSYCGDDICSTDERGSICYDPGGCKEICPEDCSSEEKITCVDSDGINYYKKGTTTISKEYEDGKGSSTPYTDRCLTIETSTTPFYKYVTEYSCSGNNLKTETYTCPNGCKDGACIKTQNQGYCGDGICTEEENEDICFDAACTCPEGARCDCPPPGCNKLCPIDCSNVGCPEDLKICPDGTSVVRTPPTCEFEKCPNEKIPQCSDGCVYNNKCIPAGIRVENKYCSTDKFLENQKAEGSLCQENYECLSNQCSNGVCIDITKQVKESQNLLQKIFGWFTRLFGGK